MSQLIKTKYSSFVTITGRRGRGTKKIKGKMGIIKVTKSSGFSHATLRALLGDEVFELVHGLGL